MSDQAIARIYRTGFACWWAELWRERLPTDPSEPKLRLYEVNRPDPIAGYERIGVQFAESKWGATRKARRMKARYLEGRDPELDPPYVEIVA